MYVENDRVKLFRDRNGCKTLEAFYGEIGSVVLDWSNVLDSGETISASSWTVDGCVSGTPTNTTTTTTWKGTFKDGYIKNTVTTSAGRSCIRQINVICRNTESVDDY